MTRGGEKGGVVSSRKVYIIDEPKKPATRGPRTSKAGERDDRAPDRNSRARFRTESDNWLLSARAYALGPVNLVLWPEGKGRAAWAAAGVISIAAAAVLWLWGREFSSGLAGVEHGALIWMLSVVLVVLLTATVWARAVATSEEVRWPRFLRNTASVCVLGLVFPGLGLLIAGRRWKAAFAIWCAGLLVAAVAIATHWRWLMACNAGRGGGLTHRTVEEALIAAAGCAVLGSVVWLALALDGVRAVSPVARSGASANRMSLALLVALVIFLATFHPVSTARELDSAAVQLQNDGLRIIPLLLYEAASTLDPGSPAYPAGAAALYDEMGMTEEAAARRDRLRERAAQFARAIDAELITGNAREAPLPDLNTIDCLPPFDDSQWLGPDDAGRRLQNQQPTAGAP
ncbi:MAG: hypothetical protein P8181_11265 [bacterium]